MRMPQDDANPGVGTLAVVAPGSGEHTLPSLVGVCATRGGGILGCIPRVASRRAPTSASRRPEQRKTLVAGKNDLAVSIRNAVSTQPQRFVLRLVHCGFVPGRSVAEMIGLPDGEREIPCRGRADIAGQA